MIVIVWRTCFKSGLSFTGFPMHSLLQIDDNLASLKFLDKLNPEVLSRIDDIFGNKPRGITTYFTYN